MYYVKIIRKTKIINNCTKKKKINNLYLQFSWFLFTKMFPLEWMYKSSVSMTCVDIITHICDYTLRH